MGDAFSDSHYEPYLLCVSVQRFDHGEPISLLQEPLLRPQPSKVSHYGHYRHSGGTGINLLDIDWIGVVEDLLLPEFEDQRFSILCFVCVPSGGLEGVFLADFSFAILLHLLPLLPGLGRDEVLG